MTRHGAGLALAAAAACFAALGVIIAVEVGPQAAELPVSRNQAVTLTAAGASYYSLTKLAEVSSVGLTETDKISESSPGNGYPTVAAWRISSSTEDTTHHQWLEPGSRTIVFDRRTAELINCCDAGINGNALIRQTGIAGYAFPVGARQQAYPVFDAVLGQPEPASYSGTAAVDGIRVYQFTEDVSAAKAPPSAAFPDRATRYSVHRVYSVDPDTGLLLDLSEDEDQYLAPTGSGGRVTLFEASLRMRPASVAGLVAADAGVRQHRTRIAAARTGCLAAAGLLAAVAAWALVPWPARRRRPPSRPPLTDGEPLPAGQR